MIKFQLTIITKDLLVSGVSFYQSRSSLYTEEIKRESSRTSIYFGYANHKKSKMYILKIASRQLIATPHSLYFVNRF